jgi:hypothetical protein
MPIAELRRHVRAATGLWRCVGSAFALERARDRKREPRLAADQMVLLECLRVTNRPSEEQR